MLWLVMLSGADHAVWAQSQTSPTVERHQDDDAPARPTLLPSWLTLAGQLEVDTMHATHIDLGMTPGDDRTLFIPELTLEANIALSEHVQGELALELSHAFVLDAAPHEDRSTPLPVLKLKEVFILLEEILGSSWSLQVGRQSFEDSRQWLFDGELDAVRAISHTPHFHLDIAAARQGLFVADLVKKTREARSAYYWLYGQYTVWQGITLAAYSLIHIDHSADAQVFFFGVRTQGEPLPGLSYWLDVAHVRGKAEGRTLLGWGFDMGLLYTLEAPLTPSLTLSVAFGSGDDTPADQRDTAFRQTGLHGNATKLASVVDFQYYGELFAPELSNLLILSAGSGLRPLPHLSLTLIGHEYHQHKAVSDLRAARLTVEPTGRSRALGRELDLIGGWTIGTLELKLALGAFWPGPAFVGADTVAFFVQGRIRLAFK